MVVSVSIICSGKTSKSEISSIIKKKHIKKGEELFGINEKEYVCISVFQHVCNIRCGQNLFNTNTHTHTPKFDTFSLPFACLVSWFILAPYTPSNSRKRKKMDQTVFTLFTWEEYNNTAGKKRKIGERSMCCSM